LTGDLPVPEILQIKSYKGMYPVEFTEDALAQLRGLTVDKTVLVIDEKVFGLYKFYFERQLSSYRKILVVADESHKNVNKLAHYVELLMQQEVKLDHTLVAIGGGIIQDITCFLASTLFRGMNWQFVPTTLLAQADSCIGSKSSINVGEYKNLMGTFYPPQKIYLDMKFLSTLEDKDICSGIGEILKVHMVKGIEFFKQALQAFDKMKSDKEVLKDFIGMSLLFKKELVETDEFDKGPRNVMNYGHSYGHAIESATNFAIPHGVAVTIGMDMANYQSFKMGRISEANFIEWHSTLAKNYRDFSGIDIDFDLFLSAIQKDKKNTGKALSLILVRKDGPIEKVHVPADLSFVSNCKDFFKNYKGDGAR
jgi:3-dehydroquinate synthase